MRRSLLSLALLLSLAGLGCGETQIGPPPVSEIPFDLTIPPNRPQGDYYAVSGITSRTQLVRVGDSIVKATIPAYYAQFHAAPGSALPLPAGVTINDNPLQRHREGDTLRLDEVENLSVFGDNTWVLSDSSGAKETFLIPKIDVIDSVGPFHEKTTFRSDEDLVFGWKRPTLGSGGMYIIWRAPDHTYVKAFSGDIPQERIPVSEMVKLTGRGKVTVIRYLNIEKRFKEKKVIVTRLAQHVYDVTVE